MAKQVDAEKALDNLKNAKFGLSIQNIIALVTVLSSLIAGWYTFTGRIDSLEAVVEGFAESSDIELVAQKLDGFEKQIDYLTQKIDSYEGVDLSDIKSDINGLKRDVKSLSKELEKLNDDPLKRFNN
jgi:peptidoglycan hydrolase CwlO-like protein